MTAGWYTRPGVSEALNMETTPHSLLSDSRKDVLVAPELTGHFELTGEPSQTVCDTKAAGDAVRLRAHDAIDHQVCGRFGPRGPGDTGHSNSFPGAAANSSSPPSCAVLGNLIAEIRDGRDGSNPWPARVFEPLGSAASGIIRGWSRLAGVFECAATASISDVIYGGVWDG